MSAIPAPLRPLEAALNDPRMRSTVRVRRDEPDGARSAVLMLLSNDPDPVVVFTERARGLHHHAGQISFPGGRQEKTDASLIETALRETHEEIGLSASDVHVMGTLPAAGIPVSNFSVLPVVAWRRSTIPILAKDPHEVASIQRWTISQLSDPAFRVSTPLSHGGIGPAWQFGQYFLWGFTAMLTDAMLKLAGWEKPWDAGKIMEVPERFRSDIRTSS